MKKLFAVVIVMLSLFICFSTYAQNGDVQPEPIQPRPGEVLQIETQPVEKPVEEVTKPVEEIIKPVEEDDSNPSFDNAADMKLSSEINGEFTINVNEYLYKFHVYSQKREIKISLDSADVDSNRTLKLYDENLNVIFEKTSNRFFIK